MWHCLYLILLCLMLLFSLSPRQNWHGWLGIQYQCTVCMFEPVFVHRLLAVWRLSFSSPPNWAVWCWSSSPLSLAEELFLAVSSGSFQERLRNRYFVFHFKDVLGLWVCSTFLKLMMPFSGIFCFLLLNILFTVFFLVGKVEPQVRRELSHMSGESHRSGES